MTHANADFWEKLHHFIYGPFRGWTSELQYVGTVKMGEEELERELFHPTDARYNWLAYWKKHRDGRNAEGSWKLRWPKHRRYVSRGKQLHITLFPSHEDEDWIDVYAHYEYDNVTHPIKHLLEREFSATGGVSRARQYFRDNQVPLTFPK